MPSGRSKSIYLLQLQLDARCVYQATLEWLQPQGRSLGLEVEGSHVGCQSAEEGRKGTGDASVM